MITPIVMLDHSHIRNNRVRNRKLQTIIKDKGIARRYAFTKGHSGGASETR